jgi:hypothetical protein
MPEPCTYLPQKDLKSLFGKGYSSIQQALYIFFRVYVGLRSLEGKLEKNLKLGSIMVKVC